MVVVVGFFHFGGSSVKRSIDCGAGLAGINSIEGFLICAENGNASCWAK